MKDEFEVYNQKLLLQYCPKCGGNFVVYAQENRDVALVCNGCEDSMTASYQVPSNFLDKETYEKTTQKAPQTVTDPQ